MRRLTAETLAAEIYKQGRDEGMKLQSMFMCEMMKIPTNIKKMPMKEFMEKYGGDMAEYLRKKRELAIQKQHQDDADEEAKGGTLKLPAGAGTVRRPRRAAAQAAQGKMGPPRTTGKRKGAAASVAQTPSGRTRSKRTAAAVASTPMHGGSSSSSSSSMAAGLETPASYSSAMLKTPATRAPQGGEIFYSKNGSPLGEFNATCATVRRAPDTAAGAGGSGGASQIVNAESSVTVALEGDGTGGVDFVNICDEKVQHQLSGTEKQEAISKLQALMAQVQSVVGVLKSSADTSSPAQ